MADKPDPARAWKVVEKALRDGDVERLDQASDDEVKRQMRAAGIAGEPVLSPEELIARARERARGQGREANGGVKVAALRARPRTREIVTWLAVAAFGVLVIGVAVERREVEAWFQRAPDTIGPDVPPPPTVAERAASLRHEAFEACDDTRWVLCEQKLDEARKIDPGGESALDVRRARKSVDGALHWDGGGKGGLK